MNDDQLEDLKQFIAATVSQANQGLEKKLTERFDMKIDGAADGLNNRIDELEKNMKDGFAHIAETIEHNNDQLDNHEQRITKLESQTA